MGQLRDEGGWRALPPDAEEHLGRHRFVPSIPQHDCPCWRLTRPLAGKPLSEFDHVCLQTAAATIYNGPPLLEARLTPDARWPVRFLYASHRPTPARQLGLVLREWAQEAPSPTLATQLAECSDWTARAVPRARGDFLGWRDDHPGEPVEAWIDDGADDPRHAALLWGLGFPETPATLRFLRACAAYGVDLRPTRETEGEIAGLDLANEADEAERRRRAFATVLARHPGALPARGVLVTTLAFVRTGPVREAGVGYDEKPEVRIAGPAEFAPGPVLDLARDVALKHRDWLRDRFRGHALADPSAVHRATATAFRPKVDDPDRHDYVAEAVRRVREWIAVEPDWPGLSSFAQDAVVQRILEQTRTAVCQRLRRDGLPTTPPKGWKATARARIDAEAANPRPIR